MKFHELYPHIYSEFNGLIKRQKHGEPFMEILNIIYAAIANKDSKTIDKYWGQLFSNKSVKKHPFFELLLYYLPLPINLLPPYLDALESALSNPNITYENRTNKIKALLTKNSFRGTCIELILADILQRQGYQVTVLGESNLKHPDIRIEINTNTVNIEVSHREYKVNHKHSQKTLIKKLREEGKQLKNESGYNIIILFFDHILNLGKQMSPKEIYTCFQVIDSLYFYKNGNKHFILEENKSLSHISAVGFLLNGQMALDYFGEKSGMFMVRSKKDTPEEILALLKNINL